MNENLETGGETELGDPLPLLESQAFVGKWNRLVSSTNWEKGKIICRWREKIAESGVANEAYSDETWSRLVGDVTAQHVGRLRRTFARFVKTYRDYPGLFWSHFYAALDWDDAELWLEGAVQNRWSISQMRRQRWEAQEGSANRTSNEPEIYTTEVADGLGLLNLSQADVRPNARESIQGPIYEAVEGGDGEPSPFENSSTSADQRFTPPLDAFAAWEDLPDDLNSIVEEFKLAILRHKTSGWQEITSAKMLAVVRAFEALIQSSP